jgi:hypothetical protein
VIVLFISLALPVLVGWALWPLVSLRSYRAREGAQQFVTLEYSGLPVKVDLQAIPSARSPRRRTAGPRPLSVGASPR